MMKSRTEKLITLWKGSAIFLSVLLVVVLLLKKESKTVKEDAPTPVQESKPDPELLMTAEALVTAGEHLIYGTDNPQLNSGGRLPVGKGQCAFCHLFAEGQISTRCPDLRNIETRSHERIKEARFIQFSEKYADTPEPDSQLKTKASTGGEYLIESLYCPSCYVVEGFGKEGSHDEISPMPFVSKMPMMLNDYEMVAVVAYLQAMDTPGDFSKVTARADWERYFNQTLQFGEDRSPQFVRTEDLTKTALLEDSPEVMIEKTACFICHKIPTIAIASIGLSAPALTMKTVAIKRINSPEYLRAVDLNRASAVTPKEYVLESILDPAAFVVPGYGDGDGMPLHYGTKFTVGALNKLVNFLMTLDENSGKDTSEDSDSKKVSSGSKRD